jgi:hypothetical protein
VSSRVACGSTLIPPPPSCTLDAGVFFPSVRLLCRVGARVHRQRVRQGVLLCLCRRNRGAHGVGQQGIGAGPGRLPLGRESFPQSPCQRPHRGGTHRDALRVCDILAPKPLARLLDDGDQRLQPTQPGDDPLQHGHGLAPLLPHIAGDVFWGHGFLFLSPV